MARANNSKDLPAEGPLSNGQEGGTLGMRSAPEIVQQEIAPVSTELSGRPQLSFDNLCELAAPLISRYLESDDQKHKRDLALEEKRLDLEAKQGRLLSVEVCVVIVSVLGLSAVLVMLGRDGPAITLVQLVTTLAAAAFGGWGYAQRRKAEKSE